MAAIELCVECSEPTGRAGRGDDSIYVHGRGPFCLSCSRDAEAEGLDPLQFAILTIKRELTRETLDAKPSFGTVIAIDRIAYHVDCLPFYATLDAGGRWELHSVGYKAREMWVAYRFLG